MNVVAQTLVERPNNAEQYSAGDVVGFVVFGTGGTKTTQVIPLTFSNLVDHLGTVIVSIVSSQVLLPNLELWLFRNFPPDQEDNTPFAPTDKELANLLKVVTFNTYFGKGTQVLQSRFEGLPIITTNRLYGVLVVRNNYKPLPSEQFIISVLGVGARS